MQGQTSTPKSGDEPMQATLAKALRIGALTAAATILLGGVLYLARHGAAAPGYDVFRGEPSSLCSAPGIIVDAISGSGRGIIQLGFLMLIATPVMRVLLSLVGFARQRDRAYVLISLTVFLLLLYSLFGGRLQ